MRSLQKRILLTLFILATQTDHSALANDVDLASISSEIHTVLPIDAIPAIFSPEFVSAEEANVRDDSPMIGVSIGDEQHAYSMYMLNAHEIVNDYFGDKPIATTW